MSLQDDITRLLAHENRSAKWCQDAAEALVGADGNLATIADPTLAYAGTPFTFTVGTQITPADPTAGGGPIVRYEEKPGSELPAGLILDPVTGQITGTPQAAQTAADSVIVAVGMNGDVEATISITINAAP